VSEATAIASGLALPADWLERGRQAGLLSSLDVQFARRLAALFEDERPDVLRALAIACRQEAMGHVCADLPRLVAEGLVVEDEAAVLPILSENATLESWLEELAGSTLVSSARALEASEGSDAPLVLDDRRRLYLRRAFDDQASLAARLLTRGGRSDLEVDWPEAEATIERWSTPSEERVDWPSVALRAGLARPLTVVTGGPGTGKTTMVARLVAAVVESAIRLGRSSPSVRLLAPTGKAAAALSASFARERERLGVSDAVLAGMPVTAETIHRALLAQTRRDGLGRPRRFGLDADLVVVDEASMVDLSLMARLFEACDPVARVVLLGDPDQLASVEAGAVLAELCRGTDPKGHPVDFARRAKGDTACEPPTLRDSFVILRESHRFEAGGAIASLAEAIREGDAGGVLALLDDPGRPEVERVEATSIRSVRDLLVSEACGMQRAIAAAEGPEARLDRLDGYRVLCALRRGPLGVDDLAPVLDEAAAAERNTTVSHDWWPGRMILVTRNAPEQDLWNGDVGLVEETELGLRALFPSAEGGIRMLSVGRVPEHESAIAMSVHKSQGSEFDVVDLVLGDRVSPLMTRELLYTGVTRARRSLRIHASEAVIRAALSRRVERASGLGDLLWSQEA